MNPPQNQFPEEREIEIALEHERAGRFGEAEGIYREILTRHPRHFAALLQLGNLASRFGRPDVACTLLERALSLQPANTAALNKLAAVLEAAGRRSESLAVYLELVRLAPLDPVAHFSAANALRLCGHEAEAITAYQQAIALRPDYFVAINNLGGMLRARRRHEEALATYRQALACRPDSADVRYNLGVVFMEMGILDEAVAAYLDAIRLDPGHALAHGNLGSAYKEQGKIEVALEHFRKAVELNPKAADMHSSLVCCGAFHPDYDAARILAESRKWAECHGRAEKPVAYLNAVSESRRIRVGFVSPDFRSHVVGSNILPFLRHHDRTQFELFCYSNVALPDARTEEISTLVHGWREISSLSDEQAAALIQKDRIDILVDLTLHTARNRLTLFARKPAPVQVTYLGYCGTTGLGAIDYRLSDPHLDPVEAGAGCYSEETIRLSRSYWAYEPLAATPAPAFRSESPREAITFGCLNNFGKASTPFLQSVANILQKVPHSDLLLQAPDGSCRERVLQIFAEAGLSKDRLRFVGPQPWDAYIGTYAEIDIALDPFPYGGGITTCDALWMGVPVVSLSGLTAVGRGGRSILSNLGLPELIAQTTTQYEEIAVSLANNVPALRDHRANLRERMEQSPLRDAQGHTREMESAFRQMWRTWYIKRL